MSDLKAELLEIRITPTYASPAEAERHNAITRVHNIIRELAKENKYPNLEDIKRLFKQFHQDTFRLKIQADVIPNEAKKHSSSKDREAAFLKLIRNKTGLDQRYIAKKEWVKLSQLGIFGFEVWNQIQNANLNAEKIKAQLKFKEMEERAGEEYAKELLEEFNLGKYDKVFALCGFPITELRKAHTPTNVLATASAAALAVNRTAAGATTDAKDVKTADAEPAADVPGLVANHPTVKKYGLDLVPQKELANLPIQINIETNTIISAVITALAKEKKYPDHKNIMLKLSELYPKLTNHKDYTLTILVLVSYGVYDSFFNTFGFPIEEERKRRAAIIPASNAGPTKNRSKNSIHRMIARLTSTSTADGKMTDIDENAKAKTNVGTAAAPSTAPALSAAAEAPKTDVKETTVSSNNSSQGSSHNASGGSTEPSIEVIEQIQNEIKTCYKEIEKALKANKKSDSKIIKAYMSKKGDDFFETIYNLFSESQKTTTKHSRLGEILSYFTRIKTELRDLESRAAANNLNSTAGKVSKHHRADGGNKTRRNEYRPT